MHSVHPVNLEVAANEHLAIKGQSGSGKSTILCLLGGLLGLALGAGVSALLVKHVAEIIRALLRSDK